MHKKKGIQESLRHMENHFALKIRFLKTIKTQHFFFPGPKKKTPLKKGGESAIYPSLQFPFPKKEKAHPQNLKEKASKKNMGKKQNNCKFSMSEYFFFSCPSFPMRANSALSVFLFSLFSFSSLEQWRRGTVFVVPCGSPPVLRFPLSPFHS